jgi:superfamily II DNA or RNA helicase
MNQPKFCQSQRVSLRNNLARKGRIDNIPNPNGGHQYYEVQWDDGGLEMKGEHELQDEILISTPWDLLSNNSLNDYRYFSIATTLHKIKNTTSNTISSLKASRTIFKPYQYKPLVKFLKSDLKRILIADEVGLGKTIEAGHIMLELAARGNLRNVLIICTNSLRDKWKTELQDKFNFILKKYDNLREFVQEVQNDVIGVKKSIFGILNYEKCRNEELQKVIEENSYRFDLLICDEAHKIRNSETAQHRGVAKIIEYSDSVVFLTATPIMTELRNLHNLVRVLDREGYDTYDIFNNAINQNRPFIRALSKLNANSPLTEIAEELNNSRVTFEMTADEEVYSREELTIGELYEDDALYKRAKENMHNGDSSVENRVKIQQDLIELNSINHLYTRTRKKDVMSEIDVVRRKPQTISVNLSTEEQEIYDSVINEYDDPNSLGLIQRKRQMSSCIVAFQTPREELERGNYNNAIPDSKFEAFKTIIDEVVLKKGKKLIVFAFFTNTLLYLQKKLEELNIQSEIIYGGVQDRTERIECFQHNDNIKVLLSSEVGSEGLDLQFCDALVNYDLPWNPMVVEQRIGRIDRVGQQSDVINIYNLIIQDTIEERIHTRLYERIHLFRESIGDLEEILGETEPLGELVTKGIESLYKTKLNEREQIAELERLRLAIENNKQTLENVRTQLAEAFANDLHFQNEIEAIEKNNRYLTKEEIIKYLESIIRLELSSLQLKHIDSNISVIEIPANGKTILYDFIEKYKDAPNKNPELENLYRKFKRHIGSRTLQLTFDQQYAYKYKSIEYISAFHPLVNAITNYFAQKNYDQNLAHKIALKQDALASNKKINKGFYVLAVYRISVKKDSGDGKMSELHFLKSALADINGDSVQMLNGDISDHIYGAAQLNCEQFHSDIKLNNDFVKLVRPAVMMEMKNNEDVVRQDEEVKFISAIKRRTEQELNYIDSRIKRVDKMIQEGKGIEAILRREIEILNQKHVQLISNQQNAKVDVTHSLISVNLLQVV